MRETKTIHLDYILFSTIAILIILGIIILASVSSPISQQKFGFPNFYLFHHLLFGIAPGIFLGFMAYKISLLRLKKWSAAILLINLFLMTLVFLPVIGIKLGGASRWISLGFASFQPSEFLKLTFILYLANWLPHLRGRGRKNLSQNLIGFLAVLGLISFFLIRQPDISTLVIILVCGVLIYFLSGTPVKHSLGILAGGISILAIIIKTEPYRLNRILTFLRPDIDPMGISYQLKQALIAVGSGGIWGKGIGMSLQKFGFLPEPMSDSIFAIFSEETGFIGGVILISLFSVFAWRGLKIAEETANGFYRLASLGIIFWIIIQAFMNIGSTVGILPLAGIPLPFISYGGSALVAELIGVGILLNIAKHTS